MSVERGATPENAGDDAELLRELFADRFGEMRASREPQVLKEVCNDVTHPDLQHTGALLGAILFAKDGRNQALDVVFRGDQSESGLPTFDVKTDIGVARVEQVRATALLVHFRQGTLHDLDSGRLFMSSDHGVSSINFPTADCN